MSQSTGEPEKRLLQEYAHPSVKESTELDGRYLGFPYLFVHRDLHEEVHQQPHIVEEDGEPGAYAAGDCIGEPMLETVAAKEGNHAVKNAFGDEGVTIDYHAVPKVMFTSPEVAAVGTTEQEYMDEYGTYTCRTVEMDDVPKAKAVRDTRGLVQVVKHHKTEEIVGIHMVGPRAADMIPEATLAAKFGLIIDDIIDTIHAFPTFSEDSSRLLGVPPRHVGNKLWRRVMLSRSP